MISLEEIIKQNSLLPPISDNTNGGMNKGHISNRFNSNLPGVGHHRVNNFAQPISKRKQVHSIGLAAYNSNPNVPTLSNNGLNNQSTPVGAAFSGAAYSRRRMQQN